MSLGKKTGRLSQSVTIASDEGSIPVAVDSLATLATAAKQGPSVITAMLAQVTCAQTTGGTAISATGTTATRGIMIQADAANGGAVWIGDSTVVVGRGLELAAGACTPLLPVTDPSTLHAVGATGSCKVSGLVF